MGTGTGEGSPGGACLAAAGGMYLCPDGTVRACCASTWSLGSVRQQRLIDIWQGAPRLSQVDALAAGSLSVGCEKCAAEIALEGRPASFPAQFDYLGPLLDRSGAFPVSLDFELSNACNLQCVQCNGESSSAIRLHRERRPPLARAYGEQFFEDLREFIPHLRRASFAGGEPLLAAENFRVWDLIRELNPSLPFSIVTNGTIWGERVERALGGLAASFQVSIDGISDSTFETIRVGASFKQVQANLARIATFAAEAGTTVTINHCLMPQNVHEFAELLLFAERRRISVHAQVVRDPPHSSIAHLPPARIRQIADSLDERADAVHHELDLNRGTWDRERARIRAWADAGSSALALAGGNAQHVILGHPRARPAPAEAVDDSSLETFADDGLVHAVEVGPGDLIQGWPESLAGRLGAGVNPAGRPVSDLLEVLSSRLGPIHDWEVVPGPAGAHFSGVFGRIGVRGRTVAVRDESGWATHARVLLAFAGVSDDSGSPATARVESPARNGSPGPSEPSGPLPR